jgi:A/G-specific adenine glycosylase
VVLHAKQIKDFQTLIFSWWKKNKRDLPWRHTHDPYRIMVSEVMLQQTQVSRVIHKYHEFLERFPTVQNLAKAPSADVLRVWKGMGYNRRALYLKRASEQIVHVWKGKMPKTDKILTQLSGLGIYTARAICIFAYRQDIATVDTNIRKIITHYFFNDVPQKPHVIEETASRLVPEGHSWEWHQALMDYGALQLQKITLKRKKIATGDSKKFTIPFRKTDRFVRGKIIDELRNGDVTENVLIRKISLLCERDARIVREILSSLDTEGLLEIRNGTCRLPT